MRINTRSDPVVSVLVNTYNYGHFLEQAIESVLHQTVPPSDVEVIVVDDGSTDDTPERIKKYRGRLTYLYKPNGGQASAFNTGFEIAQGEHIALLDADDWWFPDKLERMLAAYSLLGGDVVAHNLVRWNGVENLGLFFPYRRDGWIVGHCSPTSGISFRRSMIRFLYPVPLAFRVSADLFLISMLNLAQCRVFFRCEPWGVYRLHVENLYTGEPTPERLARRIHAYEALLSCLHDESLLRQRGLDPAILGKRLKKARMYAQATVQELRMAENAHFWSRVTHLGRCLRGKPRLGPYNTKLFLIALFGWKGYRKIMEVYHGVKYRKARVIDGAQSYL